jgi:hypothetical protein
MHYSILAVACWSLKLLQNCFKQKRLEEEAKRQERDRRKRWLALEEKGDLELSIREVCVCTLHTALFRTTHVQQYISCATAMPVAKGHQESVVEPPQIWALALS